MLSILLPENKHVIDIHFGLYTYEHHLFDAIFGETQFGRLPNKEVQKMCRYYLYSKIKNKSQSSRENKIEKYGSIMHTSDTRGHTKIRKYKEREDSILQ